MPLPQRLERILLKKGYKLEDGSVDFIGIASTNKNEILSIAGIGDYRLKKIAEELEKQDIIKSKDWLKGNVVSDLTEDDAATTSEIDEIIDAVEEPKAVVIEEQPVYDKTLQDKYFSLIGPSTLDDTVFKWAEENIGFNNIDTAIDKKIESLGLKKFYSWHKELESESIETEDSRHKSIVNFLIAYNLYRAQKEAKVSLGQGYWKASILQLLYKEGNNIPIYFDETAFQDLTDKIVFKLKRLGYNITDSKYIA